MTKNRAAAELFCAGVLWGFGFVAAVWALQAYSTTQVLVLRFAIAFVAGEFVRRLIWGPQKFFPSWNQTRIAGGSGLLVSLMLLFQLIGLKTTTASKSGFITSLYVVLVPVLNALFFRQVITGKAVLCIITALLGMLLILGNPQQGWVMGDLWTLLCALFAAFHIMYIGFHSKTTNAINPLLFNNYQNLVALLFVACLIGPKDLVLPQFQMLPVIGLLLIGLGGSLLAFTIQVRTQKYLSDTTASMLFLLESPFAFFFAWIFLSESFSWSQGLGAVLILLGSSAIHFVSRRTEA